MRVKLDARKIRMQIYDMKLTQTKLSELSGVSRVVINKALNGNTCSEESGRKICEALGIDINEVATFNRF